MDTPPTNPWRRPHAAIERILRQRARTRLGPLLELRGRIRNLQGTLTRHEDRLSRLESRLHECQERAPQGPFTAAMTMDQAWKRHGGAAAIFAEHHLPACDSCAVRFDETLSEAAGAYDLDLDQLLSKLNALIIEE